MKHLYFLLFFLFLMPNAQAQLNGTYTIGGTTPDYATVSAAANALNTIGVSGPVVFNIRPGIYTEQFIVQQFTGSSAVNTVTFQSETADTSDVIIQHMHLTSNVVDNYTVYLDGADNLVFRNLSLKAIKPSTVDQTRARVVYAVDDVNNIRFEGNHIISYKSMASTSSYIPVAIYFGSGIGESKDHDSIYIMNNLIEGGNYGLSMNGESMTATRKWEVNGNELIEQGVSGMKLVSANTCKVEGNVVRQTFLTNSFTAIHVSSCYDSIFVNRNLVEIASSGDGILLSYCDNGPSDLIQVVNNIVKMGNQYSSGYAYGLRFFSMDDFLIAHNTVQIETPTANAAAVRSHGDSLNIFNNHLVVKNGGAAYNFTSNANVNANNNNLYTFGATPLAVIVGASYNTVNDIWVNEGIDQNSLSGDPIFSGLLSVVPANAVFYDTGLPVGNIAEDYFGTPRSLTTPDIGVYEGSIPDVDVGISFTNIPILDACPGSIVPIYVKIRNFGSLNLNSATIVYNGNSFPWTGVLPSLGESDSIFVGNHTILPLTSYNLLPIWVESPNGIPDIVNFNDTILGTLNPRLNGVYTVGLPISDFVTLSQATSVASNNGICGPVVFNIESGSYTDQSILNSVNGVSSVNTITIQSAVQDSSMVTLTNNALNETNNYILKIQNTAHVFVKHLKFQPGNTTYQKAIVLSNYCDHIDISNNSFVNGSVYATSVGSMGSEHNAFHDNRFDGGTSQLYLRGAGIGMVSSGNSVYKNNFVGSGNRSIQCSNQDSLYISQNIFQGTRTQETIRLDSCNYPIKIEKNSFTISGHGLLYFFNCHGSSGNRILIANNFVDGINNCFSFNKSSFLNIYNNSIRSSGTAALYIGYQSDSLNVFNNLLNNSGFQPCLHVNSFVEANGMVCDNNGYYNQNVSDDIVKVSSTNHTMSEWNASYNHDLNGVWEAPVFVSPLDLHLYNALGYNASAIPITDVSDDFDGDLRDALQPDIGADEFDIDFATLPLNIGVSIPLLPDTSSCLLQDSMRFRVVNYGTTVVDSFLAKFSVFETPMDSTWIIQTLNQGDSVDVDFGTFSFNIQTLYQIEFEVSLPNNLADMYPLNNISAFNYFHIGSVDIRSRALNDCSDQLELYIKHFPGASIIWSTGSTDNSIIVPSSSGSYSVTVTHDNGCTVTDTIVIN